MHLLHLTKIALAGIATLASAHPGEHEEHNALADLHRREFKVNIRRSLEKCADKLEARGINARAEARRRATVPVFSVVLAYTAYTDIISHGIKFSTTYTI